MLLFSLLSSVQLFVTPQITAHHIPQFSTISQSLLKFTSIDSVMIFNHFILCHSRLLLPSVFPSIIFSFSNESALSIRWPKYLSFSFNISPSHEYLMLISLRIYWFDLLAIQGPLKSLLQHHSSKALVFQPSLWFNSHLYKTTT